MGKFLSASAGAAALLLVAFSAGAGYVLFYQNPGDWTVLCWRELSASARQCRLSAPPASLFHTARQNVLVVRETEAERFEVAVEVRDDVVPGHPLFLRVDGNAIRETAVTEGVARWSAEVASAILAEMRSGQRLVFRVQTAPDGLPRDTHISLAEFAEAFDEYRRQLRIHGLLAPGRE